MSRSVRWEMGIVIVLLVALMGVVGGAFAAPHRLGWQGRDRAHGAAIGDRLLGIGPR
jgi:hypothetical protein